MSEDVEFPLPRRTSPLRHPADAETERIDTPRNERYASRRPYTNPAGGSTMFQVPPGNTVTVDTGPTWNGFDTFLRRALMVVANVLLWGLFITGLLVGIFGVAAFTGSTQDTPAPFPTVYQFPDESTGGN